MVTDGYIGYFKENRKYNETVVSNQKVTIETFKTRYKERRLGEFTTHKTYRKQEKQEKATSKLLDEIE